MTMSEPLVGIVVAHGRVSAALIEAAESISGVRDALLAVSNVDCDRASLGERVLQAVAHRPAVVFVDMAAGSCLLAVLRTLRDETAVEVVTGVNLAMLLDFLFHRDLSPVDAAERAAQSGSRAIIRP